jgi:hypothetical protein
MHWAFRLYQTNTTMGGLQSRSGRYKGKVCCPCRQSNPSSSVLVTVLPLYKSWHVEMQQHNTGTSCLYLALSFIAMHARKQFVVCSPAEHLPTNFTSRILSETLLLPLSVAWDTLLPRLKHCQCDYVKYNTCHINVFNFQFKQCR